MQEPIEPYSPEGFLNDPDFCSWIRSERPDMDVFYRDLLSAHPEYRQNFQLACKLLQLFEAEKIQTEPARKLFIWKQIKTMASASASPKLIRLSGRIFRYAATVAVLTFIILSAWYFSGQKEQAFKPYPFQGYSEIRLLMNNKKEIIIPGARPEIAYYPDKGEIKINGEPFIRQKASGTPETNQLIVPFGKQTKVILADHSEVWLNAGSRLLYPEYFEGNKRRVQLQGEAFLKVSKDSSKPFIVETLHSSIEVLGTSFYVKAYPDEQTEETVLVEGSIRMNVGKSFFRKNILLKPNERAVFNENKHNCTVSRVSPPDYTSWIEGLFFFQDEPLPSVLKRISRFYNLQIQWEDSAANRTISGKLELKDNYRRVLNALVLISGGTYREENGIIWFYINHNTMDKE
ncbi:MAG: FecR family protein [Mangrovibacterium sp.]